MRRTGPAAVAADKPGTSPPTSPGAGGAGTYLVAVAIINTTTGKTSGVTLREQLTRGQTLHLVDAIVEAAP